MEAEIRLDKSELWKMSASYPAPTGEIETRRILKTMKTFETSSKGESKESNTDNEQEPVKSISRLTFLRILILDIIFTAVFVLTNILLGLYLIIGKGGSIQLETWNYGILVLIIPWLPSILLIPHEFYYKTELVKPLQSRMKIVLILAGFLLFPLLQVFIYSYYLNKKIHSKCMRRLDKVRNINHLLHSSLNLILLTFVTIRGQLLPGDDSSCIIDNLGRSACLLSPILLYTIISVLILLRSSISLNSVKSPDTGLVKYMEEGIVNIPYLVSVIIFRIVSYGYMFSYIDYWSIIPMVTILLVHIIIQGYLYLFEEEERMKISDYEEDDVDAAPYTLVWNGTEWSCDGLDLKKKKQQGIESQNSLEDISPVLLGIVSTILNISAGRKKRSICWSLFYSYIGNIMILSVIIAIYILVNYTESFQHESTVLDNEHFNKLSIFLLFLGLCSPLYLLLKKKNCIQNSLHCLCLFLMITGILGVPIIYVFLSPWNIHARELNLFTIISSENGSSVNIHASIKYPDVLEDRYRYSELYWDTTCSDTMIQDKRLLFINKSSSVCQDLLSKNNITVPILTVGEYNQYRSSSPDYRDYYIPNKDFIILQSQVLKSGTLYLSSTSPTPEHIKEYLSCSGSDIVEIIDNEYIDNNQCSDRKTLNTDNEITETHCVSINGVQTKINIKCTMLNSNVKFVKKNLELLPKHKACCYNTSHSLEYFGQCESRNVPVITSFNNVYVFGSCRMIFQTFTSYYYTNSCVITLSFLTLCDDQRFPLTICENNICKH